MNDKLTTVIAYTTLVALWIAILMIPRAPVAQAFKKLIAAAIVGATLSTSAAAADRAQCQYDARQWAATFWHVDSRLKVPVWAIVGTLAGGPRTGVWMAVLAANAESPRERRMILQYEAWCMGERAEPPSTRGVWLEMF